MVTYYTPTFGMHKIYPEREKKVKFPKQANFETVHFSLVHQEQIGKVVWCWLTHTFIPLVTYLHIKHKP